MGAAGLALPANAAPGSPGVPQAGTLLYSEDFSAVDASAAPIRIGAYVGGAAADGETYAADAAWAPGAGACNGWVMRKGSGLPANGGTPAVTNNDQCGRNAAWTILGDMADAMGRYQGMTLAQSAQNQILSEYTNSTTGAQSAGLQLQTTNNSIPTIAGHFYAVSGIFAETNCFSNHAEEELAILINGVPTVVGTNLDPCTDPSRVVFSINAANFSVAKLQSNAFRVPVTGATPTLGFRVRNLQANGNGNDVGFDLPQLVDVTPQLDKAFSPTTIAQGGTSTLTFTVTNTTDLMAKNGWSFTDDLPAGLVASGPVGGTCDLTSSSVTSGTISATGDLAQGEVSCTITVQVTSNTPGVYSNSGCTDPTGAPIPNCTNNISTIVGLYPPGSTPLTVLPEVDLSITKSANLDSYTPGQPITYTVTVHNDGPSDAVDATFSDPIPAAVTSPTWTCAVTAAGTATLPPSGPTACGASGAGDITDTVRVNVGGTITYTVTGVVAAGTTGEILNTATVVPAVETTIPLMPGGGPDHTPGSTTTVPTVDANCPPAPGVGCSASVATPGSSIGVVKSITSVSDANNDGLTDAGDVIHYRIVATNTGQSTLTGVTVTDVLAPPAGPALTLVCSPVTPATLAPAAAIVCTADYVITAQDAKAGHVDNTVTATGTPPDGPNVTATDTATQPTLAATPGLTLVKSAKITKDADADALAGVGDEVTFSFTIKNTGNVTMDTVAVKDQLVAPAGPEVAVICPSGPLAPGATMVCTSSAYLVTQADVDKGSVANSATASGTPHGGTTAVVTDPSETTTPTPPRTPGLSLVKSAEITKDANDDRLAGVGDEITFGFTIRNTGNVTLTNVSVKDELVAPAAPAVSVTCPSAALLPGATMVCTSSAYLVTQADVDKGSVANIATASGTPPRTTTPVVSDPSATATPTPEAAPGLVMVKSAKITKDANDDGLAAVGDEIVYSFHVDNTGNITLKAVEVDDRRLADLGISVTCPSTTLAPGEAMDCTSSVYVVTQADVDAGRVRNVATADGETPPPPGSQTPGTVTSPPSTVDVLTWTEDDLPPFLGFTDPPVLAFTGSNAIPLVAAGVLLLMTGLGLVMVARRRRGSQSA